ncbi:MAG: ABC transporter ATP-binding protein, partial [Geminicoccales bacterium]
MVILVLVVLSLLPLFLSLDLPKRIVNGPIQGEGFRSAEDTARFLAIRIPLPGFLRSLNPDGVLEVFAGFEMERVPYLVALSLTFLLLVLINGGFKLQINTMKGRLGERMMRRLRYELFDRVLRFPLS